MLYLFISISILFIAIYFRAIRWHSLFSSEIYISKRSLLLSLGVSNLLNILLPLKLGDISRIFIASKINKISFAYGFSTVFCERSSDIFLLTLVFLVSSYFHQTPYINNVLILGIFIISLLFFLFTCLLKYSIKIRKNLWKITSIFNEKIQLYLLDFLWNICQINTVKILSFKYLILSMIVWGLYFLSYKFLSLSLDLDFTELNNLIVFSPTDALLNLALDLNFYQTIKVILYGSAPIILTILYGYYDDKLIISGGKNKLQTLRTLFDISDRKNLKTNFASNVEYKYFIKNIFFSDNLWDEIVARDLIGTNLIHKFYKGASKSTLALVQIGNDMFMRKWAPAGLQTEKNIRQFEWLKKVNSQIKVTEVLNAKLTTEFYRYDMPYVANAIGFYQFIHTSRIENSEELILRVIKNVENFHSSTRLDPISNDLLNKFLGIKVINNIISIKSKIYEIDEYSSLVFNSQKYDLDNLDLFLNIEWLNKQISHKGTCNIHGDLTVENIIVTKSNDFFLIDPNPDNIFNSPLIDFSKLMQSFNLGYEKLNLLGELDIVISDNNLTLNYEKSGSYEQLKKMLEKFLVESYGHSFLREVYFHELINYIRLIPYQFEISFKKGLLFTCCLLYLLDKYHNKYDE